MGLGKYRGRFGAKGLGNMEVREVSPSAGTAYENLGWLGDEGTEIGDLYDTQLIRDEAGAVSNVLEQGHDVTLATNLQQVGIDELNIVRNASGKVHSLRYSGLVNPDIFQYYCMEQARINPSMSRKYSATKQTLPLRAVALKQDDTTFDTPEYYLLETAGKIRTENLQLWISPRHGYNAETAKVLDSSGFARHGDLNSDYATIWQGPGSTPDRSLLFDAVNDVCNFGDILDISSGTQSILIEVWIKIASAGDYPIITKKATTTGSDAGWALFSLADGSIKFSISDGGASSITNSPAGHGAAWFHIAVAIGKAGTTNTYLNSAANGSASTGSTNSSNALNLYLARIGTTYAAIQLGDIRFYDFGNATLPSDITTIIANHFAAERSYYGV